MRRKQSSTNLLSLLCLHQADGPLDACAEATIGHRLTNWVGSDGLTAPDTAAIGHRLTICGPLAQANHCESLAKVPKPLGAQHVWVT